MAKPTIDYADWLTPERLTREENMWATMKSYERYAAALRRLSVEYPGEIQTIIELGCGTGWVPEALGFLPSKYTCIDRYPGCIALAQRRNANRPWVEVVSAEIRSLQPEADVVCTFGVLKHFRVEEWQALFVQLFAGARFGVFTIPIAAETRADAYEFTHTWLSERDLARALSAAGHVELWRDTTDPIEPIITTRRV